MKRIIFAALLLLCPLLSYAQPYNAGDFWLGDTVRCPFNTHKPSTGSAVNRATAPTPVVYKDAGLAAGFNLTEFSTALTDVAGTGTFDTDKTGAQLIYADTSNGAYAAGTDYAVMVPNSTITDTGTVTIYDFVCTFSIENRAGTKGLVKYRGTLSANSDSASTAKIGTTIITADHQLSSYLIWNVSKGEKKCITDSTNGSPDVLTFSPNSDSGNWASGDSFRIMIDVPCSPLRQMNLDANGNAIWGAIFDASHPCDADCATNLVAYFKNGAAISGRKMDDDGVQLTSLASTLGAPSNIAGSGASIAANLSDLAKPSITFSGTADSGTAATMVDAALTQTDANYWVHGTRITFTSGNLAGQSACVTKFTPGTHTLEFDRLLTQSVSTQLYILTPDAACHP